MQFEVSQITQEQLNKILQIKEGHFLDLKSIDIKPAKCQRELCWSLEQYQKYVEHVLETRHGGDFIFYRDNKEYTLYVVDGQHRREAFVRFIRGDFKVLNNTVGWGDFSKKEIQLL